MCKFFKGGDFDVCKISKEKPLVTHIITMYVIKTSGYTHYYNVCNKNKELKFSVHDLFLEKSSLWTLKARTFES